MNSEWCILSHLLRDPSRVDEVFDLGLTIDYFSQPKAAEFFHRIVSNYYDYYERPTVQTLKHFIGNHTSLFRDEPTHSLSEAVSNLKSAYILRELTKKERVK